MDSRFEEKIIETGLKLFELVEGESPSVFRRQYWSGKILEWCMNNDAFKTEMFRFVDVFPLLPGPSPLPHTSKNTLHAPASISPRCSNGD